MAVDYSINGKNKSSSKLLVILLCFIIVAFAGTIIVKYKFTITTVLVTGNDHYSAEEIEDYVMSGKYGYNSIVLYFKCLTNRIDQIPFVEKMNVELISPTEVNIEVYEKAVAGYVEYLDHYLYFDKDGMVIESSTKQMERVPFVTGLDFDYITLHEKLPVEDENVFRLILNITQLLTKYEIITDRIYFDSDYNITLYFADVRVYLGSSDYLDEKINRLRFLLPELEGHSGLLHMENYKGEGDKFTFSKDN